MCMCGARLVAWTCSAAIAQSLKERGGCRRPRKACVPKIAVQFRASLVKFHSFPEKKFLMWGVSRRWPGPKMDPPLPRRKHTRGACAFSMCRQQEDSA